jgi:hypothetical protein
MNSQDAAAVLADTRSIRERTRITMHAVWFPCLLFGALALLGSAASRRYGGAALGAFWLVAAPVGIVATSLYYRRREHRVGLEGPVLPTLVGVAVIVIGCFATGFGGGALGAPTLSAAGPPLAISAGYLIFAWIYRSAVVAVMALALAGLDVRLILAGATPDTVATVMSAAFGLAFVGIGVGELARSRSRQ